MSTWHALGISLAAFLSKAEPFFGRAQILAEYCAPYHEPLGSNAWRLRTGLEAAVFKFKPSLFQNYIIEAIRNTSTPAWKIVFDMRIKQSTNFAISTSYYSYTYYNFS
jgi:hypothetical protein